MAPLPKLLPKLQAPSFHGPGEDQLLKNFLKPKQEPPNLPKLPLLEAPGAELDYRFYSHSHPCVADLIARLAEGSVKSLQAADTRYRAVAELMRPTEVKREDGTTGSLAYQARISLPDGTRMELPGGIAIHLQGKELRRIENGQSIAISPDTTVTLRADTLVQAADGSIVSLSQKTDVTLPDGRPRPAFYQELFSDSPYHPGSVQPPYPVRDLDFTARGAYSVYNWELFYHSPLTVAIHLSKNQRFEEAQQWFHYVFDPTDDSDGPTPERFWKVRPLQTTDVELIEEILLNLSNRRRPGAARTRRSAASGWKDAPFRPHVVAALPADRLHAQDGDGVPRQPDRVGRQPVPAGYWRERSTRRRSSTSWPPTSSGPRPQAVPRKGTIAPQTYAEPARESGRVRQCAARDRGGDAVRPCAASRPVAATADRIGDASQPRPRALLLRAAQRQAARLLGHGRRPAVQDPQQPEHPGHLPPAAAVRAADRPGAARTRRRRRAGRRRDRQRCSTSRFRWCAFSSCCRRPPRSARR